jgi:hypothetical protein
MEMRKKREKREGCGDTLEGGHKFKIKEEKRSGERRIGLRRE